MNDGCDRTEGSVAPLRLVVIGDALLDRTWEGTADRLCPDAIGPVVDLRHESRAPGGAGLAAMAAAALGAEVVLVTALGDDDAGDVVRRELGAAGVEVLDIGLLGPTPEKIRVRCPAGTVTRLDRGCLPVARTGELGEGSTNARRVREALSRADAVLLSDYGRGLVTAVATAALPTSAILTVGADRTGDESATTLGPRVPIVWDPHPASPPPSTPITLATPNLREARSAAAAGSDVGVVDAVDAMARRLADRWRCQVAVTCGADGVVVAAAGADRARHVPTTPADGDACGAGDWFAAGTTVELARGAATHVAVAAGCRAAAAWVRRVPELLRVDGAQRPPSRPTVVATSGCFDVLHVGHLSMLRHARSLGDRLVVLVNSDASVRRLKGHGRPVNDQDDRVELLAGLDCVDEVRIFDELTPCEALAALRPDVFVKGADYAGRHLPEEEVLAEWGGQVVLAPLVSGRSTTRVLRAAGELARRVG